MPPTPDGFAARASAGRPHRKGVGENATSVFKVSLFLGTGGKNVYERGNFSLNYLTWEEKNTHKRSMEEIVLCMINNFCDFSDKDMRK